MKKLILTAFIAATGCSAADHASREFVGSNGQAVTATDDDDDKARKIPKLRVGTPGTGDGGIGDGGSGVGSAGWRPLTNLPSGTVYGGTHLLLTDGSVMMQNAGTPDWYKLTPDRNGSYLNGTWKQLASMPNGYAPLYYASAVLPDGRVIIEGGEYQAFKAVWSTQGAVYDPVKDQWTSVAPPTGWTTIGDAQSIVMPDGRFLLADCCSTKTAIFDPATLTWSDFGTGKADINDEEGWTLLQNDNILTVDANNVASPTLAEMLSPATGVWSSAGSTQALLADITKAGGGSHEMGPQIGRPDGTVFAVGATGHTSIYRPSNAKWTAGPDLPNIPGEGQLDAADGPAVLLPNGHVLVAVSHGVYKTPTHIFEFDGASLTEVSAPPGVAYDSSYYVTMLPLPSGEILFTDFSTDIEIFTPTGKEKRSWAPKIEDACGLGTLTAGDTYSISGERFAGLSQGATYGDDVQTATNYPLVRITNRATGHVFYARTHDHTSVSIASDAYSTTSFDVPANAECGESDLSVVASGIASRPIRVHVTQYAPDTLMH